MIKISVSLTKRQLRALEFVLEKKRRITPGAWFRLLALATIEDYAAEAGMIAWDAEQDNEK